MNLPGYTAEASLRKGTGNYRLEAKFGTAPGNGTVMPQRMKLRDVNCACDNATDICVCDNGRVIDLLLGDIR
jgi:hypothetical protein